MGRVWLCTGRIAEHPLLLESEGVGLSSFEELCYYLYWNAELVGESFYNERLCQWLEEELGLAALASSLRRGIEQERSGCWCMEQILQAGGYYGSAELENALLTASENRCRALLAQSAINDSASLAMSVDRLSHVAPLGKPYYHKILAAYADNAAKTIERW